VHIPILNLKDFDDLEKEGMQQYEYVSGVGHPARSTILDKHLYCLSFGGLIFLILQLARRSGGLRGIVLFGCLWLMLAL